MVELCILRHFEDQNDLLKYGSDNPLVPNQEEAFEKTASLILDVARSKNKNKIVFTSSEKIRAVLTASGLHKTLAEYIDVDPLIKTSKGISELSQGTFNLPKTYSPGFYWSPLQEAWSAYFLRTFDEKDLHYRFGDPLKLSQDKFRFEHLNNHFLEYGENQMEFSLRFYSFLSSYFSTIQDESDDHLSVLVTHSAILSRFRQLNYIVKKDIIPNHAPLPFLEWDVRDKCGDYTPRNSGIIFKSIKYPKAWINLVQRGIAYIGEMEGMKI